MSGSLLATGWAECCVVADLLPAIPEIVVLEVDERLACRCVFWVCRTVSPILIAQACWRRSALFSGAAAEV